MKQHLISLRDLYNNALVESGFEHKIKFQKQQNTSTVANNTKKKKKKDYMV